jgi:TrmH family RNA methyltransferase
MITVVLVEPENAGNIGAVARVMANFGYKKLVLIRPKVNHLCDEAIFRAKHAKQILKSAKVLDNFNQLRFDYLIATTGKRGNAYNLRRLCITPEQLAGRLPKGNIAVVFGSEGTGLSADELGACDILVSIPTAKNHAVMNLSHAAAVVLYELSKHRFNAAPAASKAERDAVLLMAGKVIDTVRWNKPKSNETMKRALKNVLNRAFIHKRETYTLAGMFRRIMHAIKH